MKPVKNRMFCVECQRAKMLFDSKCKALNFIKFNSEEIKHEKGIAPIRVYYCKSCGGWHVTSRVRPVSERGQIQRFISKAFRMIGERNWPSSQRFLCYAQEKLRMVNERLIPSPLDDKYKKELTRAKRILDNTYAKQKEKFSSVGPHPMFRYLDLNYNSCELEVETTCDDSANEGVLYAVRPRLLTQFAGKYYYVVCTCRLNEKELQTTKKMNGLDDQDDAIQTIVCHSLNIVEIRHSLDNDRKNQYENISDFLDGEVLHTWTLGLKLRIAERVRKSQKYPYNKRSCFDYWIRLADRNVHFYLGRAIRYTCVVSTIPLDTHKAFYVFKESDQ